MESEDPGQRPSSVISRDVAAGLFLCLVAAVGYLGIRDLPFHDETGIGPGLVPKSVALMIAVLGLVIAALGIVPGSARLQRFSIRGPLFVLGAVVLFAAMVRPLGLIVAGPVAVMFAGAADPDSRPVELVIFALVLSAFCIGLFKYLLRLPIPLAPFMLGY